MMRLSVVLTVSIACGAAHPAIAQHVCDGDHPLVHSDSIITTNNSIRYYIKAGDVAWPSAPLLTTSPADKRYTYFRNVLGVDFDDTVSIDSVRAFVSAFRAAPLGQIGGLCVFQFPDPGEGWEALKSFEARVMAYPRVRLAGAMDYGAPLEVR
jgi:hypothetical protein